MDKNYWHSIRNSLLVGSKSASYNTIQDDEYPRLFQVGAPSPQPHPHPSLVWLCEMFQIYFPLLLSFVPLTIAYFKIMENLLE